MVLFEAHQVIVVRHRRRTLLSRRRCCAALPRCLGHWRFVVIEIGAENLYFLSSAKNEDQQMATDSSESPAHTQCLVILISHYSAIFDVLWGSLESNGFGIKCYSLCRLTNLRESCRLTINECVKLQLNYYAVAAYRMLSTHETAFNCVTETYWIQ